MHRLGFDFARSAYAKLEQMRRRAGADTYAELIRDALRFLDWYWQRRHDGWDVYMYNDDLELESRPVDNFDRSIGLKPLPPDRRRWWEGWW